MKQKKKNFSFLIFNKLFQIEPFLDWPPKNYFSIKSLQQKLINPFYYSTFRQLKLINL